MRTTVTIHKANNYLRITDYSPEFVNRVIYPFCKRYLCKYGKVPIPGQRKAKMVVTHTFGRMNNDKTELRVSSGLLNAFLEYMNYAGYKTSRAVIVEEPTIVPVKTEFKWKEGWGELRPHQVDWCKYQMDEGVIKINNAQTGQGKQLTLSSRIKVPGGWSTMGDMKIGTKVIAQDGTIARVDGVYPQGVSKVLRVHFGDGRFVDAGPEHLWKVYDVSLTKRARKGNTADLSQEEKDAHRWRIYSTDQLIERMKTYDPRLYIPLCLSERNPDVELPMDPYLLGVVLGDGSVSGNATEICKPYQQLFDKIQSKLPDWMECHWVDNKTFSLRRKPTAEKAQGNLIREQLKTTDILGLRSWEKFIPDLYFNGSTEQRLELLRGLLDTDGTVGKHKSISFSSSSEQLAKGVQYLVRSLGGIAKLSTRIPSFTYKGERKEGRTDYRVHIRHPNPEDLFTLDHKKERAKPTQYSDILKLRITKIEERPDEEAQCISIDHPDRLYITDDFIVTHNTFMATHTMVSTGERTLITALPRYVSIWTKALYNYLDLKIEDVIVLAPGNSIEGLANNIESGLIDPKVVIVPLTRYDAHMKREREEEGCPCLDDLFKTMGIGLRIMDEGHESVYQVYMSMLYGNFNKTLALSATLKADDAFTNQIYDYIYPREARFKEPEMKKYIDVFAYHHFIDVSKFRIKSQGFGGYSHVKFEQSILKSMKLTQMYYGLVKKAFDEFYVKDLLDKQKCLFFFATVEMCVQMLARLKADYPDFDIVKFTNEESSDKELKNSYMEHQVVVTTPQSCGTGKDIPYLYVVISPYAVSSKQRNAQMLGRLREINKWWPNLSPKFVYFVCRNIQKQIDYHEKRIEEFANKSKSHKNINSEHYIT